jgi:RIO kinase 1
VQQHDFDFDHEPTRRRRHRFDDDPPQRHRAERLAPDPDDHPAGDRWSSWPDAEHGPRPRPAWVVTDAAAVDTEYGVLKTGKEAEVHLLERGVPDTDRRCLLAAKRYRGADHRLFHRGAGYLEGRRVRRSRETRAMATRTAFGRSLIAEQWAAAEFAALGRLWSAGVAVPYPVQRDGTEVLLEFIGAADGTAAPQLAHCRAAPGDLRELWDQLVLMLRALAALGLTHGDLSAYNLLVHDDRLVMIDLPQVVDVIGNPQGPRFLERDVRNVATWFASHGLPEAQDHGDLLDELRAEVGLR